MQKIGLKLANNTATTIVPTSMDVVCGDGGTDYKLFLHFPGF